MIVCFEEALGDKKDRFRLCGRIFCRERRMAFAAGAKEHPVLRNILSLSKSKWGTAKSQSVDNSRLKQ